MRTLASIKRISEVKDIPGKDRIGLAIIDGWSVIVQKADMKAGDPVVFCEIDSVLPDRPEFEFLKNGKGLRIRTLKMAGCISQGICFPLDILPPGEYVEGADVTDILGITKWEPKDVDDVSQETKEPKKKYPKFLMRFSWFRSLVSRKKKGKSKDFPPEVSKTDEVRIQNAPWYLDMDTEWTLTEKVDGQSGTFLLRKKKAKAFWKNDSYEYIVCSRNFRLNKKDSSSYWRVSDRYNIEGVLKQLLYIFGTDWVAIQGECIAPNVQSNKYKVTEPDLYVFNLILPAGRVSSLDGRSILSAVSRDMKWVPIIEEQTKLPKTVDEMLALAHGDSALGNTIREGLVCRSIDGKQSFKAVDPLFLMKYDA